MNQQILLGVNIDHIATLRQARGTRYPEPIYAAQLAEEAGADGITVHLREDRRHIQERDVLLLQEIIQTRMNLEMAVTDEMLNFAEKVKPAYCCFVPEKREELTTEGGLNILSQESKIKAATLRLQETNIAVSLFIDPDKAQIEAAKRCEAKIIEIHTGHFADCHNEKEQKQALENIIEAAHFAKSLGLQVNAGHGLNYQNVHLISAIPQITELNIGHALIAQAFFVGMKEAVRSMKSLMQIARKLVIE